MSAPLEKPYPKNFALRQPKKFLSIWLRYQRKTWAQLAYAKSRKFIIRHPSKFIKVATTTDLNKIPKRLKSGYFSYASIHSDSDFGGNVPTEQEASEVVAHKKQEFRDTINFAKLAPENVTTTEINEISKKISAAVDPVKQTIVTSFSHDDYRKNTGGLQLCVSREQKSLAKSGYTTLAIAPIKSFCSLAKGANADPYVKVLVKGEEAGICKQSKLSELYQSLDNSNNSFIFIIHSFMGHSLPHISELLSSVSSENYFWLHDYFTLCENHLLKRNGLKTCGAPEITSNSCDICFYSKQRIENTQAFTKLFDAHKFTAVSPSEFTKNLWLEKSTYKVEDVKVISHVELSKRLNKVKRPKSSKIRIGYVGTIDTHKGWDQFQQLTSILDPKKFEFYYFGVGKPSNHRIKTIYMNTTDQEDKPPTCISDNQIDIAFIWSDWPETFCFTAHEAFFAGSYVITNSKSGNVAKSVIALDQGKVFDELKDVTEFLNSPDVHSLISYKNKYDEYKLSNMTQEIL